MAADVVPVPEDDEDVVVDEVAAELAAPAFVDDDSSDVAEWFGPAPEGGGAGAELPLEEFSSSSCCTCRMSTYSSRLAFGLVRVEIPAP